MSLPTPSDAIEHIIREALQAGRHEACSGNVEQAAALYRAVLDLQPDHAGAHHGLGLLFQQDGQLDAAIPHHAAALQGAPGEETYWLAYIDALLAARQFSSARELIALGRQHGLGGPALAAYEQQLEAGSAPSAADIDAAARLFAQGRLDEAEAAARDLIDRFPQHAFGWKLLGGVHHRRGQGAQALEAMAAAARHDPCDAETLSNLGLLLCKAERPAEAEAVLRDALALQPDNVNAHNHMALALLELGRLGEAQASASAALARDPHHANAANTLAMVLQQQCRPAEAVEVYRGLLARAPGHTDAHSNMLFCMSQMSAIGARDLFLEHRRYGERLEQRLPTATRTWPNPPEPERPLRVGFVSGDLRSHALASFVEPIFARLAGRPGLALYAYSNHPLHDAQTERLRASLAHWRDVAALDDAALEALVQADGIDILVDLSGHTAYNRLPVFARKPAPVQLSWIGYPGTTGLAAMDYYLADRFFLPPGQFDHLFTEKLVQLPILAPFQPAANAPDLAPPPALANGHVTFGSFNRLAKFNPDVIALWARLLHALPDARLLVGGMPERDGQALLRGWLDEAGIAPGRLRFHGRTGLLEYLALHNEVDLCLDTFPYSGGTTTQHALWMGVPTLTLAGTPAGATIAARQTACMLEQKDLGRFVARDADDFVERGLAACGSPEGLAELAALRAGMRERFPPPASDAMGRVADGVEDALRGMWRRWCAGLAPATFEVAPRLASGTARG